MFKTENEIADFIIKNSWILGDDLIFLGKEINTRFDEGGRIDLLFKNKKNQLLVIELKKGKITSSEVSQLVKYVGSLARKNNLDRDAIKMVLIGKSINREVKTFCSLVGIRIIEFGLVDELSNKIENYLKNINDYSKKEKLEVLEKSKTKVKYKIVKLKTLPDIASNSFMEMDMDDTLFSLFTPKRVQLMSELIKNKPSSIRDLALTLHRDIKNVFDDLMLLNEADIVELTKEGRRSVPTIKKKTLLIKLE